jgi:hypothetical protein
MKDIREELKARIEAVRAERITRQSEYRARDAELATRESRLVAMLEDEERLWAPDSNVNGVVRIPKVPLTTLILQFLDEAKSGHPTTVIAAAVQNRGFLFKPKGAARSTNMTLQNLAYRNLVKDQSGVWVLTPEGRAEAGKLKSEKEKAQQAA